jgi:uncharacterized protein (DUF952 family)
MNIFKIITLDQWEQSQEQDYIALSARDEEFIHFAEKDDITRIAHEFFAGYEELVVLSVDIKKLPGDLVREDNPGGRRKFYHLYNGSIPKSAVTHVEYLSLESGDVDG